VTSIEALTHTAILDHAEILTGEAIEMRIDQATRLVMRYLQ
jgi:hypothetical protein